MHKISRKIVDLLLERKVGTLVIGRNKNQKQGLNIGSQNNQSFVSLPLDTFRRMLTYKAECAGITVIEQEESYTSKADFLSGDKIPVYREEAKEKPQFSGKRLLRGLYRSGTGMIVNADLNGAANILRKSGVSSFDKIASFQYLQNPLVYGFWDLNLSKSKPNAGKQLRLEAA